jgi:phosphatidylglycerol:prolipoprotein diacylglycerol transferase
MFPEIFRIGPFALRSYGLMLALSFFIGLYYVYRKAKKEGVSQNFVLNLGFLVILAGIIGARLFFVFFHWSEFSGNLLNAFNPFASGTQIGIAGLNLYGGVVFAVATAVIYCLLKKQRLWQIFDIFAPAIALGIFLTRIGCFLNGCCFGTPTNLPWGVHFPVDSIPYYQYGSQCLHPAQLYSSAYGLLLFFMLIYLDKHKKFYGSTFSYLLMIEAFFRFIIEYVRYYEPEMITKVFGISFTYNHIIAICLFLLGLVLHFLLRKRQAIVRESVD